MAAAVCVGGKRARRARARARGLVGRPQGGRERSWRLVKVAKRLVGRRAAQEGAIIRFKVGVTAVACRHQHRLLTRRSHGKSAIVVVGDLLNKLLVADACVTGPNLLLLLLGRREGRRKVGLAH